MLYRDEYEEFKKELEEDINKPYRMASRELAKDYYNELVKEYPEATIHFYSLMEFICVTDAARVKAYMILEKAQQKLINELQEVARAKKSIEEVTEQLQL